MDSENQEASLVRYREKGLEKSSPRDIVSVAGLSADFHRRWRDLQVSMARLLPSQIKRISFTVAPDPDNPMPTVEVEFRPDYQIRVDAYPESNTASLQIGNSRSLLKLSTLEDVQALIEDLFPDRQSTLYRTPTIEIGKPFPETGPIEEDFRRLTPAGLEELPLHRYELRIEGLREPLSLVAPYSDDRFIRRILALYGFTLTAEPRKVERAMDLLYQLFERNPFDDPRLRRPPIEGVKYTLWDFFEDMKKQVGLDEKYEFSCLMITNRLDESGKHPAIMSVVSHRETISGRERYAPSHLLVFDMHDGYIINTRGNNFRNIVFGSCVVYIKDERAREIEVCRPRTKEIEKYGELIKNPQDRQEILDLLAERDYKLCYKIR